MGTMVTRTLTPHPPYLSSAVFDLETNDHLLTSQGEDRNLLCSIANQDQRAFDTLYHRYALRLRGYLNRYLQQPDLIDEVLQDVMLVLWQQAHRFDLNKRLSTWLFGIARHKAISAVRATRQLPELASAPPASSDQADPEVHMSCRQRAIIVTRAMDSLPPEQRTVVELTYYQGYSSQEIATHTGVSVNTVRSRLRLAQHRLASTLANLQR